MAKAQSEEIDDLQRRAKDSAIEAEKLRMELAEAKRLLQEKTEKNEKTKAEYGARLEEAAKQTSGVEGYYETRINDLVRSQTFTADGMRQRVLDLKSDADQLKSTLVALQMTPENAENIKDRAMASYDNNDTNKKHGSSIFVRVLVGVVFLVSCC